MYQEKKYLVPRFCERPISLLEKPTSQNFTLTVNILTCKDKQIGKVTFHFNIINVKIQKWSLQLPLFILYENVTFHLTLTYLKIQRCSFLCHLLCDMKILPLLNLYVRKDTKITFTRMKYSEM